MGRKGVVENVLSHQPSELAGLCAACPRRLMMLLRAAPGLVHHCLPGSCVLAATACGDRDKVLIYYSQRSIEPVWSAIVEPRRTSRRTVDNSAVLAAR